MRRTVPSVPFMALLVATTAFPADRVLDKDGKHLFILSGQSNMRGPLPDAFEQSVARVFGRDKVIVVMHARPSQPIRMWYKDWAPPVGSKAPDLKGQGELYDQLVDRVGKAIENQKLASVTFIWMQGEADAGSGWGKVYEKSFYGILDQFKRDLGIEKINFVLGRINDHWLPGKGVVDGDVVRAAQVRIGESNANGNWVDTDDLNTGVNPWGIFELDGGHFPPAGYRVLGQRFARKACRLIAPDRELDDKAFDAVFPNSAGDFMSHEAVGKEITGTEPDAARAGAGLASLLDGRYGSADPTDVEWLAFPPSKEDVELVVDLGSKRSTNEVAVSILVGQEAKAQLPNRVAILVSEDGAKFDSIGRKGAIRFGYRANDRGKLLEAIGTRPLLLLVDVGNRSARYVKVVVETDNSWLFVDEIIVNPVARKAQR